MRPHRRAFSRQAKPIQTSMPAQTAARSVGSSRRAASIAAPGSAQSAMKARVSLAQSLAPPTASHLPIAAAAAAGGGPTAGPRFLDGRTGHVRIRAEDAAVARLGLEEDAAALAVVEVLAGVGRHGLGRLVAAMRTGERGAELNLHVAHPRALRISTRAQGSTIGCQTRASRTRMVATPSKAIPSRDGAAQLLSTRHVRARRQVTTQPTPIKATAPSVIQVR